MTSSDLAILHQRADLGAERQKLAAAFETSTVARLLTATGATGERQGLPTTRVKGAAAKVAVLLPKRLTAQVEGFNLHADSRIAPNDRKGREHVARYLTRPPIANDRLSLLEDGRLRLEFKSAWSDGTTGIDLTPMELICKLLPLIPRPRKHLTRYSGILAPAAAARSRIVPRAPAADPGDPPAPPVSPGCQHPTAQTPPDRRPRWPSRHPWADLLWRVLGIDGLKCSRCGERMEVVAAVTHPEAAARILRHLGLPDAAPAPAPARRCEPHAPRPSPEPELRWSRGSPLTEPPSQTHHADPDGDNGDSGPAHGDFVDPIPPDDVA